MRDVHHHAARVHLRNERFAEPADAAVVLFQAAVAEARAQVVRELHRAQSAGVEVIDAIEPVAHRLGTLDIEQHRRGAALVCIFDVAGALCLHDCAAEGIEHALRAREFREQRFVCAVGRARGVKRYVAGSNA
jgi:hypothetical protein